MGEAKGGDEEGGRGDRVRAETVEKEDGGAL